MSISPCCFKGFQWEGTPTGREEKLANNNTYVAGSNPDVAILLIPDLVGWTFPNNRLLADHFAAEANATVYVPDFYDGWVVDFELVLTNQFEKIDLAGFEANNNRDVREPEIFECARALRAKYKKVAAVGYCYGGWACFRLGAKEHQPALVDCIAVAHPTFLTKKDIEEVAVPVQILAPEIDQAYTAELKSYTFEKLQNLGLPFDYRHFPGIEHGGLVRGDMKIPGEREAMVAAKNAAVAWFNQWLQLV